MMKLNGSNVFSLIFKKYGIIMDRLARPYYADIIIHASFTPMMCFCFRHKYCMTLMRRHQRSCSL